MTGIQRFAIAILQNDMKQYRDVPGFAQPGTGPLNRDTFSSFTESGKRIKPGLRVRLNQESPDCKQQKIFTAIFIFFISCFFYSNKLPAQDSVQKKAATRILYGTSSYYSNKFQGRKTASGEIFDQKKMTAACNVLPLGTWIRVTNLRNKKSVIVKVNDRLHHKMKRLVDLSKAAATKLNYINSGLTRVKVEVLGKKKPE